MKKIWIALLCVILAGCSVPPTQQESTATQTVNTSDSNNQPNMVVDQNTYWITNPSSGALLFMHITYPGSYLQGSGQLLPTLLIVPGGIAPSDQERANRLADLGFVVITFDADGRGQSGGEEDYNGYITQDGLVAIIMAGLNIPGIDRERYGLVSLSYGVTAAAGALARYPDLPIRFFIDWEGPVSRMYTTTGCNPGYNSDIDWQPCSDDEWWAQREAITFITQIRVPYQRIQSQRDHVQPTNNHAIEIVNAAVEAGVPWVRLNDYPANQTFDVNNPPALLSEDLDRQLNQTIADYANYIIENVLPTLGN
jgi:pimeloyl-ACP methyl ester carboxylesterase